MTTEKRVLFDASNLVAGGALQVASAFLQTADALLAGSPDRLPTWAASAQVLISPEVEELVGPLARLPIRVADRRWRLRTLRTPPFDAIATIFGPIYSWRRAPLEVMGYADITSVYPTLKGIESRGVRRIIRSHLSRTSLRRADRIIVETPAMAERVNRYGVNRRAVSVVPNTVHPAIMDGADFALTARFGARRIPGHLMCAYITRPYPHKNLPFLAPFCEAMAGLGTPTAVFVTLSHTEWTALGSANQEHLVNLGPLTPQEVRAAYEASDAVLFPSLREAFSATPIEALQVGRPLFASDRDFIRTVVGNQAIYFDPLRPSHAAGVVSESLRDPERLRRQVSAGQHQMNEWPDATDRTLRYFEIVAAAITDRQSQ